MTQQEGLQSLLADGSVWRASAQLTAGIRPQAIANALHAGRIARRLRDLTICPVLVSSLNLSVWRRRVHGCRGRLLACCLRPIFRSCWTTLPRTSGSSFPWEHTPRSLARRPAYFPMELRRCFGRRNHRRRSLRRPVQPYCPARTVVDLIRYARHVGGADSGRPNASSQRAATLMRFVSFQSASALLGKRYASWQC
jgi:hypothetical protein